MQPHLSVGQSVNFVDAEGKTVKGKIVVVHGEHDATIEIPNGTAVAGHSTGKEPGTFHFAEQKPAKATASSEAANK